MSTETLHPASQPDNYQSDNYQPGDHHTVSDHGHDDTAAHISLKGYLTGFILSVILTAIPFWLVMSGQLGSNNLTSIVVLGMAAIQIVVHMIYFLHMNTRSEGGWTMMALIFTMILVVIGLSGSLWVMHHLNSNMMPMPADSMSNMP